mmetsp:Transcript_25712/g.56024  ORF Transcript_25712/g.56024 Transcript_25712/m.56024 type:complete len:575 (+) Transcript_25712:280-2004(+)|eukprot:CAMPEP_0202895836 /NCGR_PEP_ID=MMETSP1392-20130828/4949_1 /ASSEMBLY_ACC=CAM_ASM_000868 /TAXON_ID=225041 /ORGANISM="Chlamydomonas chlamydogama, Strain SAG 11-48b" /LENGTH=574 /DNA_ID=CAMNT_0049580981 /DNA_START=169 /DNA_END=1893 /DNA_ORIENTATION=+
MRLSTATILLGFLACHFIYVAQAQKPIPDAFKPVHDLMTKLADANIFAGVAYVLKGGKSVLLSRGYGKMLPEWDLDFPEDSRDVRYHTGSVMQLMLATVAWQQHVLGKLNVYDPINVTLSAADFNLTEWCPRVWNDETKRLEGGCMYPRVVDLLAHRSGFIDSGVHCRFAYGSWQADWCYSGPNGTDFPLNVSSWLAVGALSPAEALVAVQHHKVPLQARPNTEFQDMTVDSLYCAAVLEKVTGKPFKQLITEGIFKPAGMEDTFYDSSAGNDGIYKHYLPLPGYNSFLSPLSVSLYNLDYPYIGDLATKGGDVGNSFQDADGPPYGTFRKLTKNKGGIDSAWISLVGPAGGPCVTTAADMGKWMTTLTRRPEVLGLNADIVKQLFTVGGQDKAFYFAQGTVTTLSNSSVLGSPWTFYSGNMGYAAQQYTEWPEDGDASKDVTISLVTYTKPILDMFKFNITTSIPGTGDASDPMNPNNGTTTCWMQVSSMPAWASPFLPGYGANGGLPSYSVEAYQHYMSKLANSPAVKDWVPAPHVYCDAYVTFSRPAPGLDLFIMGKLAKAALGHDWFRPE